MIRGCTDKNVHATGLPDHLLFDHYQDFNLMISCIGVRRKTVPPKNLQKEWLNALPLRAPRGHPSAILLNIQGKMSALSALIPPPPPRLLYEVDRLVCVCGGRRCRQAAREYNGVWLGRMPARQTLYHTLFMVCGRASHRVHPKMGASFWLPLESYTGMLRPLLWTTPNMGCTHLGCRIAKEPHLWYSSIKVPDCCPL